MGDQIWHPESSDPEHGTVPQNLFLLWHMSPSIVLVTTVIKLPGVLGMTVPQRKLLPPPSHIHSDIKPPPFIISPCPTPPPDITCKGLNVCVPPTFIFVEPLIPDDVLGGRAFGR